MQYSTGSYSAATGDNTTASLVSGFVATINCSTNGWGVTFTPSKIGILKVGVVINKDKSFSITNATAFSYQTKNPDGYGIIESNSWTPSEKKYAVITLAVQAGTSYKFAVSGSKMGFYGFEFTPATASVINLNASGYATYSTYYDVEISGAKAYTAELDYNGGTITCTEIAGNKVPAGNGVLLFGDANAEVTLIPTTGAAALEDNDLKATTLVSGITAAKGENDYYVLSGNAFKHFTGSSFAANKAYFDVEGNVVQTRNFTIVFGGEATGIETVQNTMSNVQGSEVYDLQGRCVEQPTKGLYIINGKKIVIR